MPAAKKAAPAKIAPKAKKASPAKASKPVVAKTIKKAVAKPVVVKTPVKRTPKVKKADALVVVASEAVVSPAPVAVATTPVVVALVPAPVKTAPAKASKPAAGMKQKVVWDSVLTLYEKILKATKPIKDTRTQGDFDRMAKLILNRDKDDQPTRLEMLRLMLQARDVAEEYGRFKKRMTEEVSPSWKAANEAWAAWVVSENGKGNQGQLAMERAFTKAFIEMSGHVSTSHLWQDGPDAMKQVLENLWALTFEVTNYTQKWCSVPHCGEPIPDDWKYCQKHFTPRPKNTTTDTSDIAVPVHTPPSQRSKARRHADARARRANGPIGGKGRNKKGEDETDGEKKRAKKVEIAAKRGEGK